MNFLKKYYDQDAAQIVISAKQGCDFAKQVANDYNPIHDEDAKRFCVPGDLLFSIALSQYGLHETMSFQFQELVKAETALNYPNLSLLTAPLSDGIRVTNNREKAVLAIRANGESTNDSAKIEQLIKHYVAFSGHNFPHILVPLMQQHQVMINPLRPLVIYENMSLKFNTLHFSSLDIVLNKTDLVVQGKRGDAELHFDINSDGATVGSGMKKLVLSGLREYEQSAIDSMCLQYSESVERHKTQ